MAYFTNSQGYLFLCSDIPFEEKQKLDDYLQLLEDSGVGKIIEQAIGKHSEKGGRPSYNPYRLFGLRNIFSVNSLKSSQYLRRNACSLRAMFHPIRSEVRLLSFAKILCGEII